MFKIMRVVPGSTGWDPGQSLPYADRVNRLLAFTNPLGVSKGSWTTDPWCRPA